MLSGVAAAAAISVSLARQRPVVPPTINERRVRCDGVMSTVLFAGVNPQTDYPGGGLSTKDKAPAIGHIWAFHSIRALTRLPPQMTTRYLGAPIARNEDRRLLTGRALFVNDVERPGMLQVAFLRSPHAHARLGTVDLSPVRARQGVVAAYAADDLGNYWKPGPLLVPPPPIEGTIFNQRSALGERQRWQALSNLPHAGGTANSNPSSSSGESCKPSVPRRVARCGGAQSISAESRLEIRRPTSAGAELPDQGSVFCERWCARRRRGQTVGAEVRPRDRATAAQA